MKSPDPAFLLALEKLPPAAWLKRSTWARLLAESRGKTPGSVSGGVRGIQRIARLADGSVSLNLAKADEWPDFPLAGLVATTDTARWWSIPPWVHHASPGGPRLGTLEGSTVRTSRLMTTGLAEVPGLVATLTPDGAWATASAPAWQPILEAEVGTAFPALVSDPGPVLLAWLLPSFAYLKTPQHWALR